MEKAQQNVKEKVDEMIVKLDKDSFRKMQEKMYLCSANCCQNNSYTMEDVGRCVEACNQPVSQTQTFLQNELNSFQNRLQRCAMDCQDSARDKVGPNTSDQEVAKYKGEMEKCVVKCTDKNVELVPAMMKRIREVIAEHDKR